MLEVRIIGQNFGRGPSKDHSTKVRLQLTQWFLRRRLKCEMLTDERRTKSEDNSSHGLKARWAKKKQHNWNSCLTLHLNFLQKRKLSSFQTWQGKKSHLASTHTLKPLSKLNIFVSMLKNQAFSKFLLLVPTPLCIYNIYMKIVQFHGPVFKQCKKSLIRKYNLF